MASVVTKYFYNEIEYLARKIGELGITENLIELAKAKDSEKIEKISDEFYAKYPEEYARLLELYLDYNERDFPTIFDGDEYNIFKKYDKEKIKIIDLICLCALSDGRMSPDNMFLDEDVLYEALEEAGYNQLVEYIQEKDLDSLKALLEAFNEK